MLQFDTCFIVAVQTKLIFAIDCCQPNLLLWKLNLLLSIVETKLVAMETNLVTIMRARTADRSETLFFPLHPAVLKPGFDLGLREG